LEVIRSGVTQNRFNGFQIGEFEFASFTVFRDFDDQTPGKGFELSREDGLQTLYIAKLLTIKFAVCSDYLIRCIIRSVSANGIERFKGKTGRIHPPMTLHTSGLASMLFKLLAHRRQPL
jgi:hypothetical protein